MTPMTDGELTVHCARVGHEIVSVYLRHVGEEAPAWEDLSEQEQALYIALAHAALRGAVVRDVYERWAAGRSCPEYERLSRVEQTRWFVWFATVRGVDARYRVQALPDPR